jgi:serine/threonine protein phosphatase PrpC
MHPMRNFVESCLGGDAVLPDMSITRRQVIEPGDIFLVCTDGLWGALDDVEIATRFEAPQALLRDSLLALGELSIGRSGAASDNTSAAALRWLGD